MFYSRLLTICRPRTRPQRDLVFFPGAHFPNGASAVFGIGTSLDDLVQQSWVSLEGDLAFSVAFFDGTQPISPVPEPGITGLVAAAGLIGLLVKRRIRSSRPTERGALSGPR